ncbi:Tetratricopeptide-like helical [Penicillium chermesinum]|nr:Tetratricopeptide-like helical [Penicillium chermesinum]
MPCAAWAMLPKLSNNLMNVSELAPAARAWDTAPFSGGGPRNPPVMSATGVGGTEGRGLTGVLYTSKGFILLELGRTSEAVTALHEAVRILGASGGGDAAGSSGVAGTLLTRALEIWAIEGNEQDERSLRAMEEESQASQGPPSRGGRSSRQRGTRHKERSTTGNSRRHPRTPAFNEGWTDEVTHTASVEEEEEEEEGVRETMEGRVEMELDQEADGLLHRALGRVRQRRLPAQTHQTPVSGRGTRHTRTHSRQ